MPLYTKNKNRTLSFFSLAMLIGVFGVSCSIALNAWILSMHYYSVSSKVLGMVPNVPLLLSLPALILLLLIGMIGAIIKESQFAIPWDRIKWNAAYLVTLGGISLTHTYLFNRWLIFMKFPSAFQ